MNIGEEICGEWLRYVRQCGFIQYNLKMPNVQGEIDVLGINLARRSVYACEVAIHLVTGLQYVGRDNRPNNVAHLTSKFRKDIQYVKRTFPEYEHIFMLWSPVVKNQGTGSKYNQMGDIQRIVEDIKNEFGVVVEPVINERFRDALKALRKVAGSETKELDSCVLRFLQVEEYLTRHLNRLAAGAANAIRGVRANNMSRQIR